MFALVFIYLGLSAGISKVLLKGDPDALNVDSPLATNTLGSFNLSPARFTLTAS